MPLYSTSISDRKRRKPHFYDSRLFIYIFRFFSLASGCFWTFYCFSWLYVHFLLPGSVFPSGSRMILDFFTAFLGFMSIFLVAFTPVSVFLSGFRRILDFFLLFLCFMSILTGSVPYCLLASGCFWTFLLFFSALCPFSPARFSVSLCLHVHFGLFSCFSRPYVHFHLLSSVFLSSFTFILDFFPCFSLLYVHFHLLSSVFLSSFTFILDFFPCFSLLYVHFHLLSSVFPSGFTFILDFFPCFSLFYIHMEEYRSLRTAKSSEVSRLR